MSSPVPARRPVVLSTRAVVGAPVAAPQQWTDVAQEALWCRGKGAQLVPGCYPNEEIKNTSEYVFRFYTKPRSSALQRVWCITANLEGGGAYAETTLEIRVPATTGPVQYATATSASEYSQIIYVEDLATQNDTTAGLSIGITAPGASASGSVFIRMISCYEQDRPFLESNSTDLGMSLETVRPNEPIGVGLSYQGLGGVMSLVSGMDARRVGLFSWASATGISRTSATPADIFSLPFYVQGPKIGRSDTTCTVHWAVYGAMNSGGGSGGVSLSSSGGASTSADFSSTTPAWVEKTYSALCDDFTASDGRVNDAVTLQIYGDGTRTLTIYAIAFWVASVA